MPLPLAVIAAASAVVRGAVTAATLGPLVKPAIGILKRFKKTPARPGIGSKVTSGPLVVGKTTVYGKARPGVGRVLAGAATVGGIGVVASHRPTPATQSRGTPARNTPRPSTSKDSRKCCPVGTKRMVCFKRGRVKKRKAKPRKAKPRKKAVKKARKRSTRRRKG
jgi:hypothetical protein